MTISMTVKAINGAVVYDIDGNRIPEDKFVTVPISPGVVEAVKAKDLEEAEEKDLPHRVMDDLARGKDAKDERTATHKGRKDRLHLPDSASNA